MFRCALTGQMSKSKEKPVKVVLETRRREYINYYENEKGDRIQFISTGSEIIREVSARAENVTTENIEKLTRKVRYI